MDGDINWLTRKQLSEIPKLEHFKSYDVDSIILLPTRKHHDSGYNLYEVVVCQRNQAIGKCDLYDTFSIYMTGKYNRVGIDCLRESALMRIFLPPNEYKVIPVYHEIRRKENEQRRTDFKL